MTITKKERRSEYLQVRIKPSVKNALAKICKTAKLSQADVIENLIEHKADEKNT